MNHVNYKKTDANRTSRWLSAALLFGVLLTSPASPLTAQAEPGAVTSDAPAAKLEWRTDLAATLAEAKEKNKLVLLRFTAEWCAPCRVMDARVWPDSAVQSALADKYLIVKSDIDVEITQAAARKYGVQAVPTLIVLNANGEELSRGGFMSSPKLINFLEEAATANDESDEPANVRS